jgi:hypothetical protein
MALGNVSIDIFREQSTRAATRLLQRKKQLCQSTIFSRTVLRLRVYHCNPTFEQHINIRTMLVNCSGFNTGSIFKILTS